MSHRAFLLFSTGLLALSTAAPVAVAQTMPALGPEASGEDAITVTARRRDEALKDVPVAVSVLDENLLNQLVAPSAADLLRQVPSAQFVSSGPEYLADISIRGQGTGRQAFSEAATGLYRNGVSITGGGFGGRSFTRMDLFDVAKVETYRGPQGALFGRNSVGGAINVITQRPNDGFGGRIKLGYEDEVDGREVQGVLNVPLVEDRLAVRVGGFANDQTSGFVINSATGRAVDVASYWGTRAAIRADLTSDITLNLTYEHFQSETPGFAAVGWLLAKDGPNRFNRSNLDRSPPVDIEEDTFIAEASADLGFATLSVVGAYKERFGARVEEDLDHFANLNPLADGTASNNEDYDRTAGEVRLSSNGDGRVRWLVGADIVSSNQGSLVLNTSKAGPTFVTRNTTANNFFTEELQSWSVFGSVSFDITDRLEVALEARNQTDEKDFVLDNRLPATTDRVANGEWEEFLPTATVSYNYSDAGVTFFRAATGYRPGGFNTTLLTGFNDKLEYNPEINRSFEIGWRDSFFDRSLQLQAAVYYAVSDDTLLVTSAATTGTGLNTVILQNATGSKNTGFEFEARYRRQIGPGTFIGSVGLATMAGTYDDGTTLLLNGLTLDLSGFEVSRLRERQTTANIRYELPIGDLTLFGLVSYQHEHGGVESQRGSVGSVPLEGFDLFDGRLGVRGDRWNLSIYGRNLGDNIYRLQTVTNNQYFNRPQSFGVELTYRFGS